MHLDGRGDMRAGASTDGLRPGTLADGRYFGSNGEVAVELRVDCRGCGVISGDLYRVSTGPRHYVASFRTPPGAPCDSSAGSWPIGGQDEHDRRAQGSLSLSAHPAARGSLTGQLQFDGVLEGLPARRPIPFIVEWVSGAFRSVGLEIEIEEGVTPIGGYTFGDRHMTIEDALLSAGIETHTTGISNQIPSPAGGWDMAQLHTVMSDLAQSSIYQRAWEIHLLLLSKSDRHGLLGVMFDTADALQRQGTAVFVEEIRGIQGIDHDRKLIQTTVHELGHALNLAHRFERVVARADSTSFMNYDWRYRGGNRSTEFWRRFQFTFDRDELEFLRHAPLAPVIPGGAPYHSTTYWSDGAGGYSPYVPEVPLESWVLTLAASSGSSSGAAEPREGLLLPFAQPVLLSVALTNQSGRAVRVPKFLLDPKAGFLEVVIRRVQAGTFGGGNGQAASFIPVMQRCFEWDAADDVTLANGKSIEDNVNLTFGSGGFAFAEPGTYEVSVLLGIFDQVLQRELVARSNTVRLRIATPRSHDEERDAMNLFNDDVGMYLALNGSPALPGARADLEDIVDRRKKKLDDPLVAHITRAMAIDGMRRYVRYTADKFQTVDARLDEAFKRFEQLEKSEMRGFDPATAWVTRELAKQCKRELDGRPVRRGPIGPQVLSEAESSARVAAGRATRRRRR